MRRGIGTALVALLIGALVFVLLHALLTPFGWGMAWGGPMMRMGYTNPVMWIMGSFFFTLVWLTPFVVVVALIVWLMGGGRDGSQQESSGQGEIQ